MIFGMVPLALALGEGPEQRAPHRPRGDRQPDHQHAADAVRGARGVHATGRLREPPAPQPLVRVADAVATD